MIEQKELKELLNYNATTGKFVWKVRKGTRAQGSEAGWIRSSGYGCIKISGKRYMTHRLVWLWVHGHFPSGLIDHINHNKTDNRLSNLRVVTHKEKQRNRPLQKNNTSGTVGVYLHVDKSKWCSQIKNDGKLTNLGRFKNKCDAIKARKDAEIELGFHPNHGGAS
jgi:hypothetical protein